MHPVNTPFHGMGGTPDARVIAGCDACIPANAPASPTGADRREAAGTYPANRYSG